MNLAVGQAMLMPVVWLDIESTALIALPAAPYEASIEADNTTLPSVMRDYGKWKSVG